MFRSPVPSRRILQAVVAVGALVPLSAGLSGGWSGAAAFGPPLPPGPDSQFRYLSGLLFAIGLAFWSTVPRIEQRGARFRLLAAIVVGGGAFRLLGVLRAGPIPPGMAFGLAMELLVTPALCWWQSRVAAVALAPKPAPVQPMTGSLPVIDHGPALRSNG